MCLKEAHKGGVFINISLKNLVEEIGFTTFLYNENMQTLEKFLKNEGYDVTILAINKGSDSVNSIKISWAKFTNVPEPEPEPKPEPEPEPEPELEPYFLNKLTRAPLEPEPKPEPDTIPFTTIDDMMTTYSINTNLIDNMSEFIKTKINMCALVSSKVDKERIVLEMCMTILKMEIYNPQMNNKIFATSGLIDKIMDRLLYFDRIDHVQWAQPLFEEFQKIKKNRFPPI